MCVRVCARCGGVPRRGGVRAGRARPPPPPPPSPQPGRGLPAPPPPRGRRLRRVLPQAGPAVTAARPGRRGGGCWCHPAPFAPSPGPQRGAGSVRGAGGKAARNPGGSPAAPDRRGPAGSPRGGGPAAPALGGRLSERRGLGKGRLGGALRDGAARAVRRKGDAGCSLKFLKVEIFCEYK